MDFKTEKDILLAMINKAQEQNLISEADDIVERISNDELTDNQYVLDLATHAYIISDFTQQLEYMYEGVDIATARGDQLDTLGRLVNVPRFPGLAAQINLQLDLTVAETTDITIPAGTPVIIDQLQVDPLITYRTDNTITIPAGTTTINATCSSDYYALQRRVPAECVHGLEGYPSIAVTNIEEGTSGRNIEDDDDYRQRILLWNVASQTGTMAAFNNYLGSLEGLDDYKLIPRPEGVGTLTIICDCIENKLTEYQQLIQENCMLVTDTPVQCINPDTTFIDASVTATITTEPIQYTGQELTELIMREIKVYIDGGISRNGVTTQGLRIGEDFKGNLLIAHIINMFPELTDFTVTTADIPVADTHKAAARDITVVIT